MMTANSSLSRLYLPPTTNSDFCSINNNIGTITTLPVCQRAIDLPVSQILMDAVDHPGTERNMRDYRVCPWNGVAGLLGTKIPPLEDLRSNSQLLYPTADVNLCNYRDYYTKGLMGLRYAMETERPVSLGKTNEAYVATPKRLVFEKSGGWTENAGRANDRISIVCEGKDGVETCRGTMTADAFLRDTADSYIRLTYYSKAATFDPGRYMLKETICFKADECVSRVTGWSSSSTAPFITDVLNNGIEVASIEAGLVDTNTKPRVRAIQSDLCTTFDPNMRVILGGITFLITVDFAVQAAAQIREGWHASGVAFAAAAVGSGFLTYCLFTA